MFWRLFLTYLLLVVAAVALVGVVVLRRSDRPTRDLAGDIALAVAVIAVAAVAPAYLLARRFTRPLEDLAAGAARLADGDLGHKIFVAGGSEFAALARTFNGMSGKLAATFDEVERDRERFRTILTGMVEGVLAVGPDQRVLFANDRAGQLLGFDPTAAVGRLLVEAVRLPGVQTVVAKGLTGPGPHREELTRTGPGERTLAVYASRLPGAAGPGAVLVLHDITDLRRLERLRQDFVANVSHELKTPLAVIRSNIEALQDGAADDPETRAQFLTRAADEADRLGALIHDLLHLARIESGDQLLDPQPVPLAEAVGECVDRHAPRAAAKGLRLLEDPPPGPVTAWADDDAFGTVLDNLIDNAIKYTPPGGTVTVRWAADGERARVDVQDTGVGIPAKDLPRIFERFYRADKSRTRSVPGTGLGLAIVKHLVQAMGGTVTAASDLGTGTTFSIHLPRAGG